MVVNKKSQIKIEVCNQNQTNQAQYKATFIISITIIVEIGTNPNILKVIKINFLVMKVWKYKI